MKIAILNKNTVTQYQSMETTISVRGVTRRVRFELRYLTAMDRWFLSMFDAQTGESYFRYVPVIGCSTDWNDLLAPFYHKNVGFTICTPVIKEPSGSSPQKDTLNEFGVVWGDDDAE